MARHDRWRSYDRLLDAFGTGSSCCPARYLDTLFPGPGGVTLFYLAVAASIYQMGLGRSGEIGMPKDTKDKNAPPMSG